MDEKLISIKLLNDTYNCDDVHCNSIQHCQDIDYLCRSIINYCLESSVLAAIPFVGSGNGDIPGWTEQVKPELDKATLWHWMWQEAVANTSTILWISTDEWAIKALSSAKSSSLTSIFVFLSSL